ncbi:hypothetical protein DBA29_20430 [Xenophilus aerolatus]|nr:hypothetical protein [Xenophilus aerolatus]
MAQSYADIQKEIAELEKKAQKARELLASRSVEEVKVLVDALARKLQAQGLDIHLAVEELRKYAPARRSTPRKERADKGTVSAPKYQGPNGELWSGKGHAPRWMKPLLAEGKIKEDFLIK